MARRAARDMLYRTCAQHQIDGNPRDIRRWLLVLATRAGLTASGKPSAAAPSIASAARCSLLHSLHFCALDDQNGWWTVTSPRNNRRWRAQQAQRSHQAA
jgi:hypothetical protein